MAGEVRIQTFVQLIKFSAYRQFCVPNPPLLLAANRCVQGVKNRIYKFVLLANESFNSLGMSEIYNCIDQNEIPFKRQASFSIRIQEDNILNKLQVESDKTAEQIIKKGSLIFSTPNQPNVKAPDFPNKFNLGKKEQEEIVIKIRK
jgi:hypothetical protein